MFIFVPIVLLYTTTVDSFTGVRTSVGRSRVTSRLQMAIGGKVLVTGIGSNDEDEFMLTLLNDQKVWNQILLGTENSVITKKKFLSRTARYSGLLNLLEFADLKLSDDEQLDNALKDTKAWIAFNTPQEDIPRFTDKAIAAGVSRAIFTTELAPANINDTSIPSFDYALQAFEKAGGSFTGIRHGSIVDGDENYPYEIVNATVPCLEDTIQRGVLARVVAELTLIPQASNKICGISTSGAFTAKYLELLRATGLNRRQEVAKVFDGGIQKLARIALDDIKKNNKAAEERQNLYNIAKREEEEEDAKSKERKELREAMKLSASDVGELEEDEIFAKETEEKRIERRTLEILQSVWKEYDVRMYTKSTSKKEFFDMNRDQAEIFAKEELVQEKKKRREILEEKRSKNQLLDKFVDVNRKQLAKLQALERKEMQSQKEMSDVWVKYVYLLIETTLDKCMRENILFHNLDEYAQTLLLKEQANTLRTQCGLAPYSVIYDPLDASVIVSKMSTGPMGVKLGLDGTNDSDTIALRGASQILELAIETLQRELPPPPPTIAELRATESASKQQAVAKMKLAAIRNRNQPKAPEESVVGRL
eukprot:gene183-314_t